MNKGTKIALTGFMGVGKSSVARHLARLIRTKHLDLDHFIEQREQQKIAAIIDTMGVDHYRTIETENLRKLLSENQARIVSLGGGAWTTPENREMLRSHGYTSVWLEATFEHCWLNITYSHKERPLARDKEAARKLFEERQSVYCLADWHFIIRSGETSFDVAKNIAEEIFG
jgi:shikimate kinase